MQSIKKDLNRLIEQRQPQQPLPAAAPVPGITPKTGSASPRPKTEQQAGTGGGIASPLAEADYTARTWHAPEILTSTDGLFSFLVRRVASITMTDANDEEVVLNFANKPSSEE